MNVWLSRITNYRHILRRRYLFYKSITTCVVMFVVLIVREELWTDIQTTELDIVFVKDQCL